MGCVGGMRRRGSPRRPPRDDASVVRGLYTTSPRNLTPCSFTDRTSGHCLRTSENSRYAKFAVKVRRGFPAFSILPSFLNPPQLSQSSPAFSILPCSCAHCIGNPDFPNVHDHYGVPYAFPAIVEVQALP